MRNTRRRGDPCDDSVNRTLRDRDNRVRGVYRPRFEPVAQPARRAALPVGRLRSAADGVSPGADPWILVVEHERHAEFGLQAGAEERGYSGVDRDEQSVERSRQSNVRQARRRPMNPRIPRSPRPTAGSRRRPGRRANDVQRRGNNRLEIGVEPAFICDGSTVTTVGDQPAPFEMRRQQPHAVRRRARVRRKMRLTISTCRTGHVAASSWRSCDKARVQPLVFVGDRGIAENRRSASARQPARLITAGGTPASPCRRGSRKESRSSGPRCPRGRRRGETRSAACRTASPPAGRRETVLPLDRQQHRRRVTEQRLLRAIVDWADVSRPVRRRGAA